jgi:hypothetical protein
MPTVLHIGTNESTWWEKSSKGWDLVTGPSDEPVWVVTDLSEETFVEIAVPRIFGSDRRNFVDRQLSSRFPDSAFRVALPPRSTGGLMERLAPPVQTLTAIEPADRIIAALKSVHVPIAGVWSCSMLLTTLGRRSSLPKDLFIVLFDGGSMRILFLKQQAPVLTRLVAVAQTAGEQAAEVVRTLRHLENTRVIERGAQRFGVMLLGGAPELAGALSGERLEILPSSVAGGGASATQWNHALFDLVYTNPPGQLAPLSFRATFLAIGVTRASRLCVALTAAIVLWMGGNSVVGSLQSQRQGAQVQAQTELAGSQIAKIELDIASFGVSPDLVRKALAVDSEEISSAPDFGEHMARLSRVISGVLGAHLKNMQWQLLNVGEPVCALGATATPAAAPLTAATSEQTTGRKVELQITVVLAGEAQPRLLAQQAAEISKLLKQVEGLVVMQDPALSLRDGNINVGTSQARNVQDMVWCVAMPGTQAVASTNPKVLP